jgi:glycerophosphoryl diester phosphodiesterase
MFERGPGTKSPSSHQENPIRLSASDRPLIIAHQGVQGIHPANSYHAIVEALGYARGVEFDTYALPNPQNPSKPEVVIIHPEGYFFHINRAGMKNHEQLPIDLESLKQVKVDGQRLVPTLREILDLYQNRCAATGIRTRLEVELKGPDTAEAVVPLLQEYIQKGVIAYQDVALCAFCYEGESKSRLQIARELDPDMTLSLSVRGGDFAQDAFKSWTEVFDYARKHSIEWLDVTRRNLTPEIVRKIHDAGFKVTCHHLRTTDELQDAISLGVDSIRADMFAGPTSREYGALRDVSDELRQRFKAAGLCRTSDWIWEIGAEVKKALPNAPKVSLSSDLPNTNAAVCVEHDGSITMFQCDAGVIALEAKDLSSFTIKAEYLSEIERTLASRGASLSTLLSERGFVHAIARHLEILPSLSSEQLDSLKAALNGLSAGEVTAIVEGTSPAFLAKVSPELDPAGYAELSQLVAHSLIRIGRLVGMAAVVAAQPLENPRGKYLVSVNTPFAQSKIFANAVVEQVAAQCLRSGNNCGVRFEV